MEAAAGAGATLPSEQEETEGREGERGGCRSGRDGTTTAEHHDPWLNAPTPPWSREKVCPDTQSTVQTNSRALAPGGGVGASWLAFISGNKTHSPDSLL